MDRLKVAHVIKWFSIRDILSEYSGRPQSSLNIQILHTLSWTYTSFWSCYVFNFCLCRADTEECFYLPAPSRSSDHWSWNSFQLAVLITEGAISKMFRTSPQNRVFPFPKRKQKTSENSGAEQMDLAIWLSSSPTSKQLWLLLCKKYRSNVGLQGPVCGRIPYQKKRDVSVCITDVANLYPVSPSHFLPRT